jgi:hypothetical protein
LTKPRAVFEDATTIGILIDDGDTNDDGSGELMSIVSVVSNDVFGDTISWTIIGTSSEEG